MANGESGVLIWSAPGNVAEGLCTPTASVTTPGKFQNVRLIHALCFLKIVGKSVQDTVEFYFDLGSNSFRPENGGKYCIGLRKRFKSCNTQVSTFMY